MKKLITIVIFTCSIGVVSAQWKKIEPPKKYTTVIKTNPFMMFWGLLPFTSEFRFIKEVATAKKQSLLYGFSIFTESPVVKFAIDQGQGPYHPVVWIKGYRFQFMYKMYLGRHAEAPQGLYTGPYYSYSTAKYSTQNLQLKDVYVQGTQWHASWVIGKQKLLGKHFCYDIYSGIGYKEDLLEYHSISSVNGINLRAVQIPGFKTHFKFCMGFNLGWMF